MAHAAEQSAQLLDGLVFLDDGLDGALLDDLELLVDALLLDLHPLQDRRQLAVVGLGAHEKRGLHPAGSSDPFRRRLVRGSHAGRYVLFVD